MTPQEVVSQVIKAVIEKAEAGVSLLELDRQAETTLSILGAISYNKGYHPRWASVPFPFSICLGVNDVIAHGVPSDYKLKDGDLLSIDSGIKINGRCGDAAITIPIGEVSNKDKNLLKYAKRALYAGIEVIKAGLPLSEIGEAIETEAMRYGYVVNKTMRGHGIGAEMHESPFIPHFDTTQEEVIKPTRWQERNKYKYTKQNLETLFAGQVICLEPMLTYKDDVGFLDKDGWTLRTRDGRKSAFFEHMIEVTQERYNIVTTHFDKGGDNL